MFFISITVRVSVIFSYLTTCIFRRMIAILFINVSIIERENTCKIGRALYGARLISNNAGHRPMFSYTDAGRRRYDTNVCDNARENSQKSAGARAIIKFAADEIFCLPTDLTLRGMSRWMENKQYVKSGLRNIQ